MASSIGLLLNASMIPTAALPPFSSVPIFLPSCCGDGSLIGLNHCLPVDGDLDRTARRQRDVDFGLLGGRLRRFRIGPRLDILLLNYRLHLEQQILEVMHRAKVKLFAVDRAPVLPALAQTDGGDEG